MEKVLDRDVRGGLYIGKMNGGTMYKINLHAHTYFSDGANSPYVMAEEAKRLGLCCLVITDHFYPNRPSEWCSMNFDRYRLRRFASHEAKSIMPVINGMELAIGKEEVLVFGSAIIQKIYQHCCSNNAKLTIKLLEKWKKRYDCAFILCHPGDPKHWPALRDLIDGYERYNSGQDMFRDGREFECLDDLPSWCNSDAHGYQTLDLGYNIIDTKVKTESDLIKYIKRQKQPDHVVNGARM